MSLPTYEGIRLSEKTRCVLILEYKCRRCGVIAKQHVQFDRMPSDQEKAVILKTHLVKSPHLMHDCDGENAGYHGIAPLQGGVFQFAIHVPNGAPVPNGKLFIPGQ